MRAKLTAKSPQSSFFGYGNDELDGVEGDVDATGWVHDSSLQQEI